MRYSLYFEDAEKHERVIRTFLLKHSTTIRLNEVTWTEYVFFKRKKYGGAADPLFMEQFLKLHPSFIKKSGRHYFFHLSPQLKKMLNKATLIWKVSPPNKHFYGFEDPTFFRNDALIGHVISHEPIIILDATPTELKKMRI